MLDGLKKLENSCQSLANRYPLVLAAVWVVVLALVLTNISFHPLAQLPGRTVKGIGKWFGSAAVGTAMFAFSYYVLREAYVQTRKRKIMLPNRPDQYLKSGLAILRLTHPLAGNLALGLAVIHFYIMWFVWSGPVPPIVLGTGIAAIGGISLLAVAGFILRNMPAKTSVRFGHRTMALIFVVLGLLHASFA